MLSQRKIARIGHMIKLMIVWTLAALFTANSLLATLRANFGAGVWLLWAFSAMFIVYGLFHKPIDAFCRQGLGFVLKIVFICGLAVFTGLFVFVAVSGYTGGAKGDEKAIIVLGAGLRGETVTDVLASRLECAEALWRENQSAVVAVTGGQGPREDIPEAVAMKRWLVARGVPEAVILEETESESTEENLLFAGQLLAKAGIGKDAPVVVVTNAFHCYRAGQYARMLGYTQARTAPAGMRLSTVLPSYFREVLAILYLWVFRGKLA